MQVELANWWGTTAQTGDRFQVIYYANRILTSADVDAFKTVLQERPDLNVDSAALLSSYTLQAVILELAGPQQLGPQLQHGVYINVGQASEADFTVDQVIQVGGSNVLTRWEASVYATQKQLNATASNTAIVTTRKVKALLPNLGIGAAIAIPALLFIGLFAYGRGERK